VKGVHPAGYYNHNQRAGSNPALTGRAAGLRVGDPLGEAGWCCQPEGGDGVLGVAAERTNRTSPRAGSTG
jgi:hypothetical protein